MWILLRPVSRSRHTDVPSEWQEVDRDEQYEMLLQRNINFAQVFGVVAILNVRYILHMNESMTKVEYYEHAKDESDDKPIS
jgi:hypothetical protein